jgi:hypothetical protein
MLLGDESLEDYYRTNFYLMHKHKYSLTELEEMLPWERSIYLGLLEQQLDKEKEA